MKENFLFEILLTDKNVTPEAWLNLFNSISKLNGLFHTWCLYAITELNEVRYFVKTNRILPPIINPLNDFLLKQIESYEIEEQESVRITSSIFPYLVTNKEKNILDIFDKAETKQNYRLKATKMSIFSYRQNHFITKTRLFFEKPYSKLIKKYALFVIPHYFFSIDFSIYNRFFYRKNANEYLNIEKALPLLRSEKNHALLKIDTFPYLSESYYLNQTDFDFDKHSIVVGSSGTGKSKLISSLITNTSMFSSLAPKYKFIVIDPHASLQDDIGGIEKTQIIDFKTLQTSADLFMNSPKTPITASTELILSLFKSLIADHYNSKLERVLRQSIHLLLQNQSLNFKNLRKLLLEIDYRNQLIKSLEQALPDTVINFFLTDFNELKATSYQEAIAPILSFIDEMELLPAFQLEQSLTQIQDLIQDNFLTIFSLNQVILGEKITKTISGFVMQQILELIQNNTFEEHLVLVIDEVALVENPILTRFLSEARKYNLSVILIQQYFNQISEELKKSIFANASNFYIFRVSKSDAILLENNLRMEVAVHNSYKIRLKILTELKDRQCIARISKNGVLLPAFKASTLPFSPIAPKNCNQILTTNLVFKSFDEVPYQITDTKSSFQIGNSISSLKEIMISQSSSRKELKNNG